MITTFNKQLTFPEAKFRGSKWDLRFPCYASLKLDGEMGYVRLTIDNELEIVNKWGRVRRDFPALNAFESFLQARPELLLLAETYYDTGKTKKDFYSLLRNKKSDKLKIAIWGIANKNTEDTYAILTEMKNKGLSVVPFWKLDNKEDLKPLIGDLLINLGFEGLVVRKIGAVYLDGNSKSFIKVKQKSRERNYKNAKYGIWI